MLFSVVESVAMAPPGRFWVFNTHPLLALVCLIVMLILFMVWTIRRIWK